MQKQKKNDFLNSCSLWWPLCFKGLNTVNFHKKKSICFMNSLCTLVCWVKRVKFHPDTLQAQHMHTIVIKYTFFSYRCTAITPTEILSEYIFSYVNLSACHILTQLNEPIHTLILRKVKETIHVCLSDWFKTSVLIHSYQSVPSFRLKDWNEFMCKIASCNCMGLFLPKIPLHTVKVHFMGITSWS